MYFIAFERFIFGLGISLIFLPLLLGHFSIVSDFLSIYPFSVLSRLSFAMYLLNYNVIRMYLLSQKDMLAYNSYNTVRDSIFIFILCMIVAIPLTLIIEMPSINLEKLLCNTRIVKKKKDSLKSKEEYSLLLNQEKEQNKS